MSENRLLTSFTVFKDRHFQIVTRSFLASGCNRKAVEKGWRALQNLARTGNLRYTIQIVNAEDRPFCSRWRSLLPQWVVPSGGEVPYDVRSRSPISCRLRSGSVRKHGDGQLSVSDRVSRSATRLASEGILHTKHSMTSTQRKRL